MNNCGRLSSLVYLKNQNKLILCDSNECLLKVFNLATIVLKDFKHEQLKKPEEMCLGKNDDLFVSDHSNGDRILVFDANLNYLRCIKLKAMDIHKMKIDLTDNRNLLYLSDWRDNKIVVRYSENNKFKNVIDILGPTYMEFDKDFMYVMSEPIYTKNKTTGQIEGVQKKSNCIFLLNKTNYSQVRSISLDDWLVLGGLHFNKFSNIQTIAYELDKNKNINDFYLYIFKQDGNLIQKLDGEIEDGPHKELNIQEFVEAHKGEEVLFVDINDEFAFVCYKKMFDIFRI